MCLAVPVQVLEFTTEGMARVEIDGVKFDAATVLVEGLKIGDYVIVHAGHIIEKLEKEDALDKLSLYDEYLEKIGEK